VGAGLQVPDVSLFPIIIGGNDAVAACAYEQAVHVATRGASETSPNARR
jgi:hypothetical protein